MNKNEQKRIYSPVKRKVLLLLTAGIALGFSGSPRAPRRIFNAVKREWKYIDKQYLYRIIKEFREERLVDYRENDNGSVRIVITERGKEKALEFKIDEIKIKEPNYWDKKWRAVFFDIPEKRRGLRDALREKLKYLGFFELQESVFVHPFPCFDEINFLVEYFQIRKYVRMGELTKLTNEEELILHFNLD